MEYEDAWKLEIKFEEEMEKDTDTYTVSKKELQILNKCLHYCRYNNYLNF